MNWAAFRIKVYVYNSFIDLFIFVPGDVLSLNSSIGLLLELVLLTQTVMFLRFWT